MFCALSPEIHHQLLGLVDVEGEVVLLTPFSQGTHLLSVGRLIFVSDQGKARQGKFIYIAHFIHSGNSKCFTEKKVK